MITQQKPKRSLVERCGIRGAWTAIVLSIPLGGIVGVVIGFPVPFVGRMVGFESFLPSAASVVFFGIAAGGFLVLGFLGAVGGVVVGLLFRDEKPARWATSLAACGVATAFLVAFSVAFTWLDF